MHRIHDKKLFKKIKKLICLRISLFIGSEMWYNNMRLKMTIWKTQKRTCAENLVFKPEIGDVLLV